MSALLDPVARLDSQRSADLDFHDAVDALLDVFPELAELQALECARLREVREGLNACDGGRTE